MKNKTLSNIVKALPLVGALASPLANADNQDCVRNVSFGADSMYKFDVGPSPVRNSIMEGGLSISCGNFDAYTWGALNNKIGKVNEVDVEAGYSVSKEDFSGRIGLGRYFFPEDGGNIDVAVFNLNYDGPVNIYEKRVFDITSGGSMNEFGISKTFNIEIDTLGQLALTPSVVAGSMHGLFGYKGLPTNITYGFDVGGNLGDVSFNLFMGKYDGKTSDFGDDEVVTLTFNKDF